MKIQTCLCNCDVHIDLKGHTLLTGNFANFIQIWIKSVEDVLNSNNYIHIHVT